MKKDHTMLLNLRDEQRKQGARIKVIADGLQLLTRTVNKGNAANRDVQNTVHILQGQLSLSLEYIAELEAQIESKERARAKQDREFNPVRNHIVRTVRRNAIARNIDYPDYFHMTYDLVAEVTGYDLRALQQGDENGLDVAERLGILQIVLDCARTCCAVPIQGGR